MMAWYVPESNLHVGEVVAKDCDRRQPVVAMRRKIWVLLMERKIHHEIINHGTAAALQTLKKLQIIGKKIMMICSQKVKLFSDAFYASTFPPK